MASGIFFKEDKEDKKDTEHSFNEKFSWYLAKTGLAQKKFAELVDKRPSTIKFWTDGVNLPQEAQLITIIEVLLKNKGFDTNKEMAQARELWELHDTLTPFNEDWFKELLNQSKNGLEKESKINQDAGNETPKNDNANAGDVRGKNVINAEFEVEHGLMLKPKGEGDVIKWSEFQKGKIVLAGQFNTFFTVRLTDAVTIMWRVCQNLDAECERVVLKSNSLYESYFKIEYRSVDFVVTLERDWDSGIRMILTTENLSQLTVTITVKAKEKIATKLLENFKRQPGVQAIKILKEW